MDHSSARTLGLLHVKNVLVVICGCLVLAIAVAVPSAVFTGRIIDDLHRPRPDNPVDQIIRGIMASTHDFVIPTRYSVAQKFLVPPSDQGRRGTCWGFAAMSLLESQYRAAGIDRGFLQPNEYVSFSKQGYMKWLLDRCAVNRSVPACQHGGLGSHSTEDHKLDAIYYFLKDFPDLSSAILPEAVCPYQPDPDGQDICPGFDAALQTNPIRFQITSITAAEDIEGAKRLLLEAGRPIGIGVPVDSFRFFAPCDSSNWSSGADCGNKSHRCPEGFTSEFCAVIDLDARLLDGVFGFVDDVARSIPDGGHAMSIVGYNDDWIYRSRRSGGASLSAMRGGFIVHNSWGDRGHSVDYLMGRVSEENEATICPNMDSPSNWLPAVPQCIRDAHGDVTKCGTGRQRVRGNGTASHADRLSCVSDTFCNRSRNYALAEADGDVDTQPLASGFDRVHLVSWATGDDVEDVYIDWLPFWALRDAFAVSQQVPNTPGLCGYWVYPYDAVALVNRVQWSLLDTFHVTDVKVEFPDESFARSGKRLPGTDYFLLVNSTHTFDRPLFDGPLPYDLVF